MSDRNRLSVQKNTAIPSATDMAAGERLLLITPTGYKALTKATAQALFGGGGGGSPITRSYWDAQSTEQSIGLQVYVDTELTGMGVTFDGPTHTLSFPAGAGAESATSAYVGGVIPRSGKHWFYVEASQFNPSAFAALSIGYFDDPAQSLEAVVFSETAIDFQIFGDTWTLAEGDRSSVLIAIDYDAGQLSIERTGQTSIVVDVERPFDLVFSFVGGNMNPAAETTLQFVIDNNPTSPDLPAPVPAGFIPLNMLEPVLPAVGMGSYLTVEGQTSRLGFVALKEGDSYVNVGEGLLQIPSSNGFAVLDRVNRFTKGVVLDRGTFDSTVVDSNPTSLYWGAEFSGGYQAFKDGGLSWSLVIGLNAANALTTANNAIVIGASYTSASHIDQSIQIGHFSSTRLSDQSQANTSVGNSNLNVHKARSTVALGNYTVDLSGFYVLDSVAVGTYALRGWNDPLLPGNDEQDNLTLVERNVAVGSSAMTGNIPTSYGTAVGYMAMGNAMGEFDYSVALGAQAMHNLTANITQSVALGAYAMRQGLSGAHSAAVGYSAMEQSGGSFNVAVGAWALQGVGEVYQNVAVGTNALTGSPGSDSNTAVGFQTMRNLTDVVNSTALGANATVTGSNQVQLGGTGTTTYAYGAVQDRSDIRDKAEVRDTQLGLEFVLSLRPVDFKWDMREDYIDWASYPVRPEELRSPPTAPLEQDPDFDIKKQIYDAEMILWERRRAEHEAAMIAYNEAVVVWTEKNDISKIVHDGTHTRNRYHHGFIAGEVKQSADAMGVDFGGYQDHSLNGGKDVKSLGHQEFIAPIVKSIQELNARLTSPQMIDLIAEAVLKKLRDQRA